MSMVVHSQLPLTKPLQLRAKATLDRLTDASEKLLRQGGLDAATVPAIAELAGHAVGAVYRRFPDKDALVRAGFLRWLDKGGVFGRGVVPDGVETLDAFLDRIARALILGTRRDRVLIQSLERHLHEARSTETRTLADRYRRETLGRLERAILQRIGPGQPVEDARVGLCALFLLETAKAFARDGVGASLDALDEDARVAMLADGARRLIAA